MSYLYIACQIYPYDIETELLTNIKCDKQKILQIIKQPK